MRGRAKILLAGILVATTAYAGAATSQTPPTTTVVNDQVQLGDVFSTQTLNVQDATGSTVLVTTATGNSLSGSVEDSNLDLTSSQAMGGNAEATTTVNGQGSVGAGVSILTEAIGNGSEAAAYNGNLTSDVNQAVTSDHIQASTTVTAPTGQIYEYGDIGTAALGNSHAYSVTAGTANTTTSQSSNALVDARTGATVQYMPGPVAFTSSAIANNVSGSGENSTQTANVDQLMAGSRTQASTFVGTGNAWEVIAASTAVANNASIANQGGSLAVTVNQDNGNYVRSEAVIGAFQYGGATAVAYGVGNSSMAAEDGGYLTIDNTQFNSGGVEVISSFTGVDGYDSTVSATAIGNATTGYACSECQAVLGGNNRQVNSSDVSATTSTTVNGSGRSVTGVSNAVGNSATFYVTRPGG